MGRKHVLLIEDDGDIRRNLEDLLESEGYRVEQAENGRQALKLLEEAKELPALILLDLMMPVMDGFQFRATQRLSSVFGAVPVLVMTADSNIEEKRQKLGAHGFLRKPVDADDLLDKIAQFCVS